MKILVTGSNGQLGSEIRKISGDYSEYSFDFHDIDTLNLLDPGTLELYFNKNKIGYVINCAAYTAVDKAETDKEGAYKGNVTIVTNLVFLCKKYNSKYIHISTDYVFDGTNYKPYTETDKVNPQGEYGRTKLLGEKEALQYDKSLVIRTSWLYSSFGNNFVKTMLRLGREKSELRVIYDQVGSPTFAADLAKAILQIINQSNKNPDSFITGIYHFSNEGVCSWYDFAKEILTFSQIKCPVWPIETKDYPTPAIRPHYSVFNKNKIKSTFNISIPHWKDSLYECLQIILKDK